MNHLIIQLSPSDHELKKAIIDEFGENVEYVKVKSLDGLEEILQAIIPYVPVALNFLVNYFTKKQSNDDEKRVVITKDGEISLIGYTKEEVEEVLNNLKNSS